LQIRPNGVGKTESIAPPFLPHRHAAVSPIDQRRRGHRAINSSTDTAANKATPMITISHSWDIPRTTIAL
jgi:hypothetical protein